MVEDIRLSEYVVEDSYLPLSSNLLKLVLVQTSDVYIELVTTECMHGMTDRIQYVMYQHMCIRIHNERYDI